MVRVRVLAGDIVLCPWARHFTLTVPFSTQVYKWIPATCWGKPCDGLASHPGWISNTPRLSVRLYTSKIAANDIQMTDNVRYPKTDAKNIPRIGLCLRHLNLITSLILLIKKITAAVLTLWYLPSSTIATWRKISVINHCTELIVL